MKAVCREQWRWTTSFGAPIDDEQANVVVRLGKISEGNSRTNHYSSYKQQRERNRMQTKSFFFFFGR